MKEKLRRMVLHEYRARLVERGLAPGLPPEPYRTSVEDFLRDHGPDEALALLAHLLSDMDSVRSRALGAVVED